jgi:hypothetical protein
MVVEVTDSSDMSAHICQITVSYPLKCHDCPKKYRGQTGKTFSTKFKEPIHCTPLKENKRLKNKLWPTQTARKP